MSTADFESLKLIRQDGDRLEQVREVYLEMATKAEMLQQMLSDVRLEKQSLLREKNEYLGLLRAVQQDIDATSQLEDRLVQRHEAQQAELKQLQDVQFEPLKAQLDEMRAVHNLPRLPTLEHERNERQKSYMEARMQDWNIPSASTPPKRVKKR